MDHYELIIIGSDEDVAAYHQIRHSVLFGGRSDYMQNDAEEMKEENLSLLLKYRNIPIGTVRLDQKDCGKAIVRLVAIVSELQGRGHGTILMHRMEKLASSLRLNELYVHARPTASKFYSKLGYSPFIFELEASHGIQMHKLLS